MYEFLVPIVLSVVACEVSCKTCGPDSPDCTSCPRQLVLKEGKCVAQCGDGYYAETIGLCKS